MKWCSKEIKAFISKAYSYSGTARGQVHKVCAETPKKLLSVPKWWVIFHEKCYSNLQEGLDTAKLQAPHRVQLITTQIRDAGLFESEVLPTGKDCSRHVVQWTNDILVRMQNVTGKLPATFML